MVGSQNVMYNLRKKIRNKLRDIIDFVIYLESFFWSREISAKRLLIIKTDALGDFLLFSPTLGFYRKIFPNYEIDLMVSTAGYELAKYFKNNVDKLLVLDRSKFNKNLFYRRKIFRSIYKMGYEIVVYPTYSREVNADHLVKFAKAKESIGWNGDTSNITDFDKKKGNRFYTKIFNSNIARLSELDRNYEFIEFLGCKTKHNPPSLPQMPVSDKLFNFLTEKYFVIHPGSSIGHRMWPLEKYVELIKKLNSHFNGGVKFVITGSLSEKRIGAFLQETLPGFVIDMIGQTDVANLVLVLKNSRIYIGSDTGAAHISAAVGTPTVCVMGGGHLKRFFPYGDLNKNRIVYDAEAPCLYDNWRCCEHIAYSKSATCIASVTVQDVFGTVIDTLKQNE